MTFKITKLSDRCFLINALAGQIPKASPSAVIEVVGQIRSEFHVNPNGIQFFWPEGEQVDKMLALLPASAQPSN
jgi:hypothetical protein